jgi:BASS family bile acid:Na+ symporter
MIKAFSFHPAVEITIGLLAATPVPPILPASLLRAGGRRCYVLGLLVSQAVLAILFVPLIVRILDTLFPSDLDFGVTEAAAIVLKTILGPLAVGLALGRLFGDRARRAAGPLAKAANVLLICAALPLLLLVWGALKELVGEGLLLGLAVMITAGLAAGHLLGGPDDSDRTVLALATAAAHPGVAIAIANDFPDQRKLVAGAVLFYLILRAVLVIPYVRWRRRRSAPQTGGAHAPAHV